MRQFFFIFFACGLALFSCQKTNKAVEETHQSNRVYDSAGLLTNDQLTVLQTSIRKIENDAGPQIAIVISETLGAKNINEVSLAIAEKLKLGRQEYRDGLLIFLAYRDREIRIEVGYGLERIISDEVAKRMIFEKITPRFRETKYYEGLAAAIDEIDRLIRENKKLIGRP